MIALTLEQLADVVGGEVEGDRDGDRVVDHVTIDSREARHGSLFVALPGSRADGHDFVADAVSRGATGYLRRADHAPLGIGGAVVVDDPGDALLGLGAWVRDEVDPTTVAITGSVGKTTTKDLVAAAVGAGRRVVANPGSYNNELGVPLTMCRLERGTGVLVTEIGARGIGHIAQLAPLVRPNVAVVTSVAAAHLELFGDLETVARAKGELVEAVAPDGVAVLNADDPRVAAMASRSAARVVTYGVEQAADWQADDVRFDGSARASFRVRGVAVRLRLPGAHNIGNALAALAVADAVGVPVTDAAGALEGAVVSPWRMELSRSPGGVLVLNDAYNANPASTAAALTTLAALDVPGRRWAVLGEMAELGSGSSDAHRDIGRLAAERADAVVVVGERAAALAEGAGSPARLVADADEAIALLRAEVESGDAVLVKASRSVGLELIAAALLEAGA